MVWFKLFLLGCLLCNLALAAETYQPPSHLLVDNRPFVLELHRNTALLEKMRATGNPTANHYRGQLPDLPGSWVRISQIDGHWQGLASVAGEVYVLAMNDRGTLNAMPAADTPVPVCEIIHPQSHSTVNTSSHSALPVAQQVQFTTQCSSTVDGICLLSEMEFAFDLLFQQEFGAQAEAQAFALINMVEGFYLNNFNIAFDTLTLQMLNGTTFSSTTEPGDLLDELLNQRQTDQLSFLQSDKSLFHLVTGRDFNGSTAGTAFVDSLCRTDAVGTSQLLRDFFDVPDMPLTALVIAHELGHNFGASHDGEGNNCTGNFIMAPSVSASTTDFSSCSQTSITDAIGNLVNPQRCFNYPAAISINAIANNPVEAQQGRVFTLDYQINVSNGFIPVPSLTVSGLVPAQEGQYNAATLNGQNCSIASDSLSFVCVQSNPGPDLSLQVLATANGGIANFTQSVAISGTLDVIDLDPGDNSVLTSLAVTAATLLPNAASNLTLAQGTGLQISILWQDQSDNENGFRLERNSDGGSFAQIAVLASDTTRYFDTDILAGTAYQYRLIAFNDAGSAAASNIASITPVLENINTVSRKGGGGATSWPSALVLLLFAWRKKLRAAERAAQ